ncbi:glycosyltransferase [bacterium]|nr:glycosyltransferase [bacterium]NIN93322.1 glycosyltransferase [bacterium]NIO19117.1 glycosyltransferase [bacterium]NIO74248.1 glycosyltransferase [bacterium]
MDYSVVIPVYNERDNLEILLNSLTEVMDSLQKEYEIICINDGSSDGSDEVLRALKRKYEQLMVLEFERNCGLTAALAAGFFRAQGEIVITMDADMQNDPQDIPKLLKQMGDYDVVCGVRSRRHDPWLRIISSRIANYIRNKVTKEEITDVGCTLRAYKRKFLSRLKLFDGMHRFLPTLLKWEGAKVVEVEVDHHPRLYGKTKYGVWNRVFKAFIDLLAVVWMKRRRLNYKIKE